MSTDPEHLALDSAELYPAASHLEPVRKRLTPKQRKAFRGALARRRLEIYKEQQWLREALYDVLEDSDAVH